LTAYFDEEVVDLTATEFTVLRLLIESVGAVVSKEMLSQEALGRALDPLDRSVDAHMVNLRRKLTAKDAKNERCLIKTVRGAGYLLAINQV
jgi:two-component system response regulator CpxR